MSFRPGTNSHNGTVFRRGPDRIPRGTIASLYRAMLDDDGDLAEELLAAGPNAILPARAAYARSLLLALNDPAKAPAVGELIADRLEGRPKQTLEQTGHRTTIFYKAGDPPPLVVAQERALSPAVDAEILPPPPPSGRPARG